MGEEEGIVGTTIRAQIAGLGVREAIMDVPDPDLRLLELCRQGDVHAFETLFRKYQTYVYNIGLGMLSNSEDAADVTQETFLRLHRSLDSFRGDSSFSTWLYRVAVNLWNCAERVAPASSSWMTSPTTKKPRSPKNLAPRRTKRSRWKKIGG